MKAMELLLTPHAKYALINENFNLIQIETGFLVRNQEKAQKSYYPKHKKV